MIQKQWIPWEINDMIEEIRENMHITHAQITHIFREGNQLADFLVNHAMDNEGILHYDSFAELPVQARKKSSIVTNLGSQI